MVYLLEYINWKEFFKMEYLMSLPYVGVAVPYVMLVIGFVCLIKGADFFVDGSGSIAKKLRVPDIIIGLTVVAMGTSMPELVTSIVSSFEGNTEFALGNVVGSNIINVLVILGLSAVILPIAVDPSVFKRDMPVLLLTAIIVPVIALLTKNADGGYMVGRVGGIILMVLFIGYILLTIKAALDYRKAHTDDEEEEIEERSWLKSILFTVGGAAVIVIGAKLAVSGAETIALQFNVSKDIIGLTVIALGTSLPELVTSAVAAKKGNSDIALGNIVGSNIFNVLLVLGTTATINPVPVPFANLVDLVVLLGVSIYLAITARTGKKISRFEGITYLVFYAGYLAYLLLRL